MKASSTRGTAARFAAKNVVDGNDDSYWATDDGVNHGSIELDLRKPRSIHYISLQEFIRLGQRIKAFNVEAWIKNAWQPIATGTTIGYKRILAITPVTTQKIRVNFTDAKASPVISAIKIY